MWNSASGDPPGIEQGRYDFSRKHILDSVDQSLMRLKTEYLDMLLLHRPDPLVNLKKSQKRLKT